MAIEECVICGKRFDTSSPYAKELGMGDWACSSVCWEEAMKSSLQETCLQCGRTFDVRYGYTDEGEKCQDYDSDNIKFCSFDCYERYNSIRCLYCGKTSLYSYYGYCSKSCYEADHEKKNTNKNNNTENTASNSTSNSSENKNKCEYCGQIFTENGCEDTDTGLKFCCLGHKGAFKRDFPDEYQEAKKNHDNLVSKRIESACEKPYNCTLDELLQVESMNIDGRQKSLSFEISERYRVKKDYDNSFYWAQKSANLNNSDGIARLGWHYIFAHGCKKDLEKGISMIKKVLGESAEAQCIMGTLLYNKLVTDSSNTPEDLWKKAAMNGSLDAMLKCGLYFKEKGEYTEAIKYLTSAAEKNYGPAQGELSKIYKNGTCGQNKDEKKALQLALKAAESGDATALRLLADFYDEGILLPKDYEKAFDLYNKAAEKGNNYAKYKLGLYYLNGNGCIRDLNKSYELLKKLADNKYSEAIEAIEKNKKLFEAASVWPLISKYDEKIKNLGGSLVFKIEEADLPRIKILTKYNTNICAFSEWHNTSFMEENIELFQIKKEMSLNKELKKYFNIGYM